jgi:hypothetical protein
VSSNRRPNLSRMTDIAPSNFTTAGTSFQTANFNIFSNPEKTFGIST